MDRPYESIPSQGTHQGERVDEEPSTNVRAQPAPYPPEHEPEAPAFGLYHNEAERTYRIRPWRDDAPPEAGYTHVETGGLDALTSHLPESARFVVFENPETGEVYYDKQGNLTGGVPGGGFTQLTVFGDEIAAAAYADERQRRG